MLLPYHGFCQVLRGVEVGQLDGTEMDKKDASILRKYGSIDGYKKTRAGRCAKNGNNQEQDLKVIHKEDRQL